MRKTITQDNALSSKKVGSADRGEVSYDPDTKTAVITLNGVSEETAIRAARVVARHTSKAV